jgi:hypothetical protein
MVVMVVRMRQKRRPAGAPREVRSIEQARCCATDGCEVHLSRYNPTSHCGVHRGWDHEEVHRKPRHAG